MARRGEGLYLHGKHKNIWWLDCIIHKKRYQLPLGKGISRSVAQELAAIKRAQIIKGEEGIGIKKKDSMFDKAKEEFLKWTKTNKRAKTIYTYRQCLDHLTRSFTGKRLSEIHPFLVEKHKRVRVEAGAPIRANRELAVLKNLFNRCREWNLYEGDNPVTSVKFLKEPKQRLRYLEREEEERLLSTAPEPLRSIIILGTNTGLRVQAEVLILRWEDVDLTRGFLTVQAAYAKSGQTRTVPLNSTVQLTLDQLRPPKGDFVFSKPDGTPYRSIRHPFVGACNRAGVKNVSPHTLRHTFASRLAMAGVDLRTIQELGGWKDLSLVERYSHLSPNHKARAVELISQNSPMFTPIPEVRQLATVG